jgi:BirA family biotin operon repressor/biotin-[acetyl-CoA-carboxylase] ligase
MSLAWRFERAQGNMARLGLLTALAVVRTLTAFGARDLALKWPNDVFWHGKKLGGILLELMSEAGNGCHVVIGIGVNVRMPKAEGEKINQPWANLATAMPGSVPPRNLLAARLLDELVSVVLTFQHGAGRNLPAAWRRYDFLAGKVVELRADGYAQRGKALGVDSAGCLVLESDGQCKAFACGEVSVSRKA